MMKLIEAIRDWDTLDPEGAIYAEPWTEDAAAVVESLASAGLPLDAERVGARYRVLARVLVCHFVLNRLNLGIKKMNTNSRLSKYTWFISALLLCSTMARAQLLVTASLPKLYTQNVVVRLALTNSLAEKIESARAVVFVSDDERTLGRASRWVIGGSAHSHGLSPGATNVFNFFVPLQSPASATNLTAKIIFTRLVLDGGKIADVKKDVRIEFHK